MSFLFSPSFAAVFGEVMATIMGIVMASLAVSKVRNRANEKRIEDEREKKSNTYAAG